MSLFKYLGTYQKWNRLGHAPAPNSDSTIYNNTCDASDWYANWGQLESTGPNNKILQQVVGEMCPPYPNPLSISIPISMVD